MADNLIFTRIWQDVDFFQISVECKTEFVALRGNVYTTDDLIDDLYEKIEMFLSGNFDAVCWQNGTVGDKSTPCVILKFLHKDKVGRVLIEVFMEIDDGGMMTAHNCCFYLNTEIGLLYQFKDKLTKLKTQQLGIKISLNEAKECN